MHIAEADWDDAPQMPISFKMAIREAYSGLLIYAGKYDTERAEKALTEGWADMIGFGRLNSRKFQRVCKKHFAQEKGAIH